MRISLLAPMCLQDSQALTITVQTSTYSPTITRTDQATNPLMMMKMCLFNMMLHHHNILDITSLTLIPIRNLQTTNLLPKDIKVLMSSTIHHPCTMNLSISLKQ